MFAQVEFTVMTRTTKITLPEKPLLLPLFAKCHIWLCQTLPGVILHPILSTLDKHNPNWTNLSMCWVWLEFVCTVCLSTKGFSILFGFGTFFVREGGKIKIDGFELLIIAMTVCFVCQYWGWFKIFLI